MKERTFQPIKGWGPTVLFVSVMLLGPIVFVYLAVASAVEAFWPTGFYIVCTGLCVLLPLFGLFGCMPVQPNQARVLLLFGNYIGSVVESGFYWTNPLYNKKKISLRIRNFETGTTKSPEEKDATGRVLKRESRSASRPSKVNDRDGNPIEMSAVVVWRVVNTAEALFEVDDYEDFVAVQSEAALRNLATRHPYDSEDHEVSLRGNTVEISEQLKRDIQDRLEKPAGRDRSADQPPGLRPGNRRRDATATASPRGRRRPHQDRPRRRGHGGNGAPRTVQGENRGTRRRATGPHGFEPAGRALRRSACPTGDQHRVDVLIEEGSGLGPTRLLPPARRSGDSQGPEDLGGGRAAQLERTDRVLAARGARRGGTTAQGIA